MAANVVVVVIGVVLELVVRVVVITYSMY